MFKVSKMLEKATDLYNRGCLKATALADKHSTQMLFAAGVVVLLGGIDSLALAQEGTGVGRGTAGQACGNLLRYMEGAFGALVAAAAGVGAIIASAVGGFKAAWSLLVVSIGAFILRAYITLWNGSCLG